MMYFSDTSQSKEWNKTAGPRRRTMTDPTREQVAEAIDWIIHQYGDDLEEYPIMTVLAAARLWLEGPTEAQIERAAKALDPYMVHPLETREAAERVLRAAFTPEDTP